MINENCFRIKKNGEPRYNCYCVKPESIENYDKAIADTEHMWGYHHRLETHNSGGERRIVELSRKELITLGMYYDRPPEELIFMTIAEHTKLHHKGKKVGLCSDETRMKLSEALKGRTFSEKTKEKMSEAKKGKCFGENNSFYGKHHSEETKRKISEAKKGKPAWNKGKHFKIVDGKHVYY